jgi:ankyrin repeat protein
LLTAGADATLRDKNHKTALMYTAENNRDSGIIEMLEQYEKIDNKL